MCGWADRTFASDAPLAPALPRTVPIDAVDELEPAVLPLLVELARMFLVPGAALLAPRTGTPAVVTARPDVPLLALAVVPLDAADAGRAIPLPALPGAAGRAATIVVEVVADVWRVLAVAAPAPVLLVPVPVPGGGRATPGRARVVGARDCLVPVPVAFVDGG